MPKWKQTKSYNVPQNLLIRVHISISFSVLPFQQFCFYAFKFQLGNQKFKHLKLWTVLLNFVSLDIGLDLDDLELNEDLVLFNI